MAVRRRPSTAAVRHGRVHGGRRPLPGGGSERPARGGSRRGPTARIAFRDRCGHAAAPARADRRARRHARGRGHPAGRFRGLRQPRAAPAHRRAGAVAADAAAGRRVAGGCGPLPGHRAADELRVLRHADPGPHGGLAVVGAALFRPARSGFPHGRAAPRGRRRQQRLPALRHRLDGHRCRQRHGLDGRGRHHRRAALDHVRAPGRGAMGAQFRRAARPGDVSDARVRRAGGRTVGRGRLRQRLPRRPAHRAARTFHAGGSCRP